MSNECQKCGVRPWRLPHRCEPVFLCWCVDYGQTRDDATEIRACDHEDAATSWASRWDSRGDYDIVRGSDVDVHVELTEDNEWDGAKSGDVRVFVVTGESVPHYSAFPKKGAGQ